MPDEATATVEPQAPEPVEVETTDTDWQAEAEKWKALARKHETRSKENSAAAKQLEEQRQAAMTEHEKALAEAEKRGRQSALEQASHRIAAADIRAALSGVVNDPDSIIEDLNLTRYITDDGDVDAAKVKTLRDKYAALAPRPPSADLKQGVRRPVAEQDSNAWFNNLVQQSRKTR